jgi:hypothetical protein
MLKSEHVTGSLAETPASAYRPRLSSGVGFYGIEGWGADLHAKYYNLQILILVMASICCLTVVCNLHEI